MPDFEVRGNPDEVTARAATLRTRGQSFVDVARSLSSISTDGWSGRAADRFREKFEVEPERWQTAGDGFLKAAGALDGWAWALRSAKSRADWCRGEWQRGEAATAAARSAYDADVAAGRAEKAAWEADNGPGTFTLTIHPFEDPGQAIREGVRSEMAKVRADLDRDAHECAAGVNAGASGAPASRNWLETGLAFIGGVFVGAGEALWDLGELAWSVSPLGQLMELSKLATGELTPEEFAAKQQLKLETVEGLWTAMTTDPMGFGKNLGKALLDWDTWTDDPARALGHLVPDAVAAVVTGGTAAAGTRGASALGAVARHGDDIVEGAVDAGRVAERLEEAGKLRKLDDLDELGDLAKGAKHVDLDAVPEWAQEGGRLRPSDPGYDLYPRDYDRYGGLSRQEFFDKYWDEAGETWRYPPRDGFGSDPVPAQLTEGDVIDRFSNRAGQYTSPDGTPFDQRALPPSNVGANYTRYEVLRELPPDVLEGRIAPAFGQPGGGIQHFFPKGLEWYVQNGYLKELK